MPLVFWHWNNTRPEICWANNIARPMEWDCLSNSCVFFRKEESETVCLCRPSQDISEPFLSRCHRVHHRWNQFHKTKKRCSSLSFWIKYGLISLASIIHILFILRCKDNIIFLNYQENVKNTYSQSKFSFPAAISKWYLAMPSLGHKLWLTSVISYDLKTFHTHLLFWIEWCPIMSSQIVVIGVRPLTGKC